MTMRGKFTAPGTSIHYYVVEFDPKDLSWEDFRGKVLGPTDPKDAPAGSLRGIIAKDWKALGLKAPCNGGDEYIALAITFNCDSTTLASSFDAHTMDNVPTLCPYNPIFLAKLCANAMACPSLLNILNANASLSQSPLANPW